MKDTCPVDAKNGAVNGAAPTPAAACACSGTGQAKQFDQLLEMHADLMAMLSASLEQNQELMQAMIDNFDDGSPTTYLDGTKVS